VASSSIDGSVILWDILDGRMLLNINVGNPIFTVEFNPNPSNDKYLILSATCENGLGYFWQVDYSYQIKRLLSGNCKSYSRDRIRCASFSPGGTYFVTGGTDGLLRIFNPQIKMENHLTNDIFPNCILDKHNGYINSISFSQDGTRIVSRLD